LRGPEYIFDQSRLRSYNLIFDVSRWEGDDPFEEAYVPCSLTVDFGTKNATTTTGAGCRYKGSVGSFRMCFSSETGELSGVCRKLSVKVDANYFVDDGASNAKQRVFGLKKLLFHGMAVDKSLMSERLSYSLLNVVGLAAPRAVHAQVYFNGALNGVYTLVEEVDDVFTEDRFRGNANGGGGGLYKDAWVRSRDEAYYSKHREDGEDEDAFLVEAAQAVMAADAETADLVLEHYFDAESIVTVTAANVLLGMSDDWRQRHNFLWYVREGKALNAYTKVRKQLVMIPWDYDRLNDDERHRPWPRTWDDVWEKGDERCSAGHKGFQERALMDLTQNRRPASELWYFEAIHSEFPDDILLPIQCEQFTKVLAWALGDRVRLRVKELAATFDTDYFKVMAVVVADQIRDAVALDEDPPRGEEWALGVRQLRYHFLLMRRREGHGTLSDEDELDALLASGVRPSTNLLGQPSVGTSTFVPLGAVGATGGSVVRLNSAWQHGLVATNIQRGASFNSAVASQAPPTLVVQSLTQPLPFGRG
jgi:hypothetical protein